MESNLAALNEAIINYLNNIININILLISISFIVLFWVLKKEKKINNQWWLVVLAAPALLSISSLIYSLIVYKNLITELQGSELAGDKDLGEVLNHLDLIFWLDIVSVGILLIGLFGVRNERSN